MTVANNRRSTKLRELLKSGRPIVVSSAPGALFAQMLERAGIDCLYSGGNNVSQPLMGIPQHVISPSEFVWVNHWIARSTMTPVIADLDNGFGGYRRIKRMVEELI